MLSVVIVTLPTFAAMFHRAQCRIGRVFCTFAHYLKMYAVYLNNVKPCRQLLAQLGRRSRDFDDVIKRLEVTTIFIII